jgi:hypothetical protein
VYEYDSCSWVQLGDDIDSEGAGDVSGLSLLLSADGKTVAVGAQSTEARCPHFVLRTHFVFRFITREFVLKNKT